MTIDAAPSDGDMVRLIFRDDGRGMTDEHRSRVFEPFFTTSRGQGGSGLGLHIVHNLVVGVLKGSIAVDSAVGRGTAFTLLFPRRTPDDPPPAPPAARSVSGRAEGQEAPPSTRIGAEKT